MWRLWIMSVVLACGGHDEVVRGLCEPCAGDSECASGTCWQYGDGVSKCTYACTIGEPAPDVCPPPESTGQCNGRGYCMCEAVFPGHDGGVDDGGYRDAAMVP
jgi:hypothetical protein